MRTLKGAPTTFDINKFLEDLKRLKEAKNEVLLPGTASSVRIHLQFTIEIFMILFKMRSK